MNAWQGLSDVEWIFFVLAAIYCWECVCWLRGSAVCLSSGWGKCRLLGAPPPFESEQGRLAFANPSPLAYAFVCQPWPVPMDDRGFFLPEAVTAPAAADGVESSWLPYERVESVSQTGRNVLVNGQTAATLVSESHAAFVAAALRKIVAADESQRRHAVESLLDEMTDAAQVSRRFDRFRQATSRLRLCCAGLMIYTFGGGPLLYYAPGPAWRRYAGGYLAGFLAGWFYLVYRYVKTRRTLHCEDRRKRLGQAAMLLLSPASAMRAAEALSRDFFADVEPLAAAAAVCSADDFASFAETSLRSSLYPIADRRWTADAAAERGRNWFAERRARRLRRLIDSAGLDSATLLHAPRPSHDAISYCPRCLRQYSLGGGHCPECPGVAMTPFVGAASLALAEVVAPDEEDPL